MKGFTLIEMIVVTAIIALLAGLMLANYRGGSESLRERQSLQVIAQALRSAQNKALGASRDCAGQLSCEYYGVHFDTGLSIINIFGSEDGQYDAGIDAEIETMELEEAVSIVSLSSGLETLDVLFRPPYSEVSFNPSASSGTITITGGGSVSVGGGGSVDIN